MTIKRLSLILLTILVLAKLIFALLSSFSQPQVQSRLELYQTNLVLQAVEFQVNDPNNPESENEFSALSKAILGANPYKSAKEQYQEAHQELEQILTDLQAKLSPTEVNPQQLLLLSNIQKTKNDLNDLDLSFGILQAQQEEREAALATWNQIVNRAPTTTNTAATAATLSNLWRDANLLLPEAELNLHDNLNGWFRYRALSRLYQLQERESELLELQNQEQQTAQKAVLKLALIGVVPVVTGLTGLGILIFCGIQWLLGKENSILATNGDLAWKTPWNGEIIWQVLVGGFFFIGQILLPELLFPLTLAILGLDPQAMDLRAKALLVLVSYLLTATSSLAVLYFSLKPFFPLPQTWFSLRGKNWLYWAIGGYLAAIPLVVIVSLLNQLIFQGKGGSNPIILLALQSQDLIALTIFFVTASIAAPVFEELIFRGFLLPSLTRYFPVWLSILGSSLLFALAHLSLSEVLPLTTLGIALGFVYTRSRNILAPMLVHSLWNGGTLISLFILGST